MTLFLFVLGLFIGSFLNVVGSRWQSGIGIGGRSFCPICRRQLRWYELIPLVSYLIQGGRCRSCSAKISIQYPLVEIWTGLLFATLPLLFIPVLCVYVVITVYDFKHKIIPDALVYTSILMAVVYRIGVDASTLDWLAGPIIFLFFGGIWLLSKGRAMGFGDAKLGLSLGLLLGAVWGFSAVVMSFWIGAILTLLYMGLSHRSALLRGGKRLTMKSEIPFAPFMILGAWASILLNLNLLNVSF
jgi:prepilin signal peptidase PulO-like enzyme (type II secretory pathway)